MGHAGDDELLLDEEGTDMVDETATLDVIGLGLVVKVGFGVPEAAAVPPAQTTPGK